MLELKKNERKLIKIIIIRYMKITFFKGVNITYYDPKSYGLGEKKLISIIP